ncbi:MAG: hypothetical protein HC875_02390 [Anaerolineales bacterium]|nr:hypothetical protein [Anaerolineales bacterium]
MKIFNIVLAAFLLLFGLRMVLTAGQTAISGKILVRQGIRSKWQPAAVRSDAWKLAIRDGLMGLLLIVLGVVLIF